MKLKMYTAAQLTAMPTLNTIPISFPKEVRHLDEKLFFKHDGEGYRWSLLREDGAPRLHRKDGAGRWRLMWPPSLLRTIEPMERAAREAHRRKDHVVCLLLFHALLECFLRSDVHESPRAGDGFKGAARAYRRRLLRESWSDSKAERRIARLDEINALRNNVIHEWLPLEGYEMANERIGPRPFGKWVRLYNAILRETFKELPM